MDKVSLKESRYEQHATRKLHLRINADNAKCFPEQPRTNGIAASTKGTKAERGRLVAHNGGCRRIQESFAPTTTLRSSLGSLQCFPHRPHVVCETGGHRGRHADGLVPPHEVVPAKCRQYAAHRFSHFFANPFVNLVKRRTCILIVRFCRSTCDVQIFAESGLPMTGTRSVYRHRAGRTVALLSTPRRS